MSRAGSGATATLARGREAPFLGRHPWVFSGSIADVNGSPADGDVTEVRSADGRFVAWGLFNGRSQIRIRLYSWDESAPLTPDFFAARLSEAVEARRDQGLLSGGDDACRLVFSEGDGLSGLVVDRYGDWLAVQFTSFALAQRLDALLDWLEAAMAPRGIYLRTEKGILEEEGLVLADGLVRGEAPDGPVTIRQGGARYLADIRTGQKTGFFLDQRLNRARAAEWARGRRAADVFCYTGAFTVEMLRAGATSVHAVDSSAGAIEAAQTNLALNGLDGAAVTFEKSDAFSWLEARSAARDTFDMIVLDPPRFARSAKGVPQALRGYERLNELAVRCLAPGGVLVTCSCTGRVSRGEFVAVLSRVEARTGRRIRILESRGQAPDHPVSPSCPETEYLKCLVCRVD